MLRKNCKQTHPSSYAVLTHTPTAGSYQTTAASTSLSHPIPPSISWDAKLIRNICIIPKRKGVSRPPPSSASAA